MACRYFESSLAGAAREIPRRVDRPSVSSLSGKAQAGRANSGDRQRHADRQGTLAQCRHGGRRHADRHATLDQERHR